MLLPGFTGRTGTADPMQIHRSLPQKPPSKIFAVSDVTGSRMLVALSRDLENRGIGLSYVLLTGEAADILCLDETTRDLTIHSRETTIADIIRIWQE